MDPICIKTLPSYSSRLVNAAIKVIRSSKERLRDSTKLVLEGILLNLEIVIFYFELSRYILCFNFLLHNDNIGGKTFIIEELVGKIITRGC